MVMKNDVDVYLGVVNRLEPELTSVDADPVRASIAISLRRIAGYLERLERMASGETGSVGCVPATPRSGSVEESK